MATTKKSVVKKAPKADEVKKDSSIASRDEKENPSDAMAEEDASKVRPEGAWIKATPEEIAQYEEQGILVGHDRRNGEVLLLETE